MQAMFGEEVWTLDDSGVTIARVVDERHSKGTEQVLRRLVARVTGVPDDDVELERRCGECGARHGVPTIEYPTLPSGGRWHADVAFGGGVVVAAASARHPLGVAVETAGPSGRAIDEAAFHTGELALLETVDASQRARLRATMWVRKAALARVLGHRAFLEPARVELSSPHDDGGTARLVRAVPELGARWHDVAVHDVPVAGAPDPGHLAAAVAILG